MRRVNIEDSTNPWAPGGSDSPIAHSLSSYGGSGYLCFFFLMVLWIEQRSSHNVGKCSSSDLPPSPSTGSFELHYFMEVLEDIWGTKGSNCKELRI